MRINKYNHAIHHLDKLNSFPALALSCLAQWLDHSISNRGVAGSILLISTVKPVTTADGSKAFREAFDLLLLESIQSHKIHCIIVFHTDPNVYHTDFF